MAIVSETRASVVQQGAEALRRGAVQTARAAYTRATTLFPNDPGGWFGLAVACRTAKDSKAALAAIDRVLTLEPASWRAFLVKADCYADLGDARAASSFYSAAVRRAPQQQGALAPEA